MPGSISISAPFSWDRRGFLIYLPHCAGTGDGFLGVMSVGLFFEIGRRSTGCGVEVATPNAIMVRGTVELWGRASPYQIDRTTAKS